MNQPPPKKLKNFLEEVNAQPAKKFSVEEVREAARLVSERFSLPKIEIALIEDRKIQNADLSIPIRIYHPKPDTALPLLLYLHGGGHLCGNLETHDKLCRRLAKSANCVTIAVDYRLAPEHPYPAGLEDCRFVLAQLKEIRKNLEVDLTNIFLGGDSAGGNLASTLAYEEKMKGNENLRGLALIYPSVDFVGSYDSTQRNARGYLLTKEKIDWYFNQYFSGENKDRRSASPMHFEHLEKLPPTYIAVAEYDPLYDEDIAFGEKLKSRGVPVEIEIFEGMIHVFAQLEKLAEKEVLKLVHSIAAFIHQQITS